jgi:mono/diheme cytochrome c family protein
MKYSAKIFFVLFLTMLFASMKMVPQEDWPVPGKYKKMENPVPNDKESLSIGKQLWSVHCRSCHGKSGLGDGPKAADLDTDSGDFSSSGFQEQSDGELFYKTTFGRGDMPAYENIVANEEDRWILVHYMRTFED